MRGQTQADATLRRARARREALYDAMVGLRAAIDAGKDTNRRVGAAARLCEVLATHTKETEAPDGLLAEVVQLAPRLSHATDVLRDEHAVLLRRARALADAVVDRDAYGRAAAELLAALEAHQRRAADLIDQCYAVDIGGEG